MSSPASVPFVLENNNCKDIAGLFSSDNKVLYNIQIRDNLSVDLFHQFLEVCRKSTLPRIRGLALYGVPMTQEKWTDLLSSLSSPAFSSLWDLNTTETGMTQSVFQSILEALSSTSIQLRYLEIDSNQFKGELGDLTPFSSVFSSIQQLCLDCSIGPLSSHRSGVNRCFSPVSLSSAAR